MVVDGISTTPDILAVIQSLKTVSRQDRKGKDQFALAELKLILGPFTQKNAKKEVLKDLPDLEEKLFIRLPEGQMQLIEKEKSKPGMNCWPWKKEEW